MVCLKEAQALGTFVIHYDKKYIIIDFNIFILFSELRKQYL